MVSAKWVGIIVHCTSRISIYLFHRNAHPEKERERERLEEKKEMEKGLKKWHFRGNEELLAVSSISMRGYLHILRESLNKQDERACINLSHGDPSAFPSFQTSIIAEDAVVDALRSRKYNSYSQSVGILPARRAVAEYLERELPYNLSAEDVYLTIGCKQAIEYILAALARPNANILLSKPGYPDYDVKAANYHLQVRHFDLLPEKGWEVDLEAVEALADENTVAMVIVNPGNPCGNVYTHQHLKKVAETARKLGIMVIADEVYGHLSFGPNPFVPMGAFASIAPVVTLGSISKRWIVPGWRLGWLVINDPNNILAKTGVVDCVKACSTLSSEPATFVQGAIPEIFEKTNEDFFSKTKDLLRHTAGICYDRIKEIPSFICPYKPEGAMSFMVKLNLSVLEGIHDDMEFCTKLANEENIMILPGRAVGLKNWLRVTFALEPSTLEEGLARVKSFCRRHTKKL
ncbi:hypothetical protein L6164_018684 [Bauhinia variegata]|uniref:Uncharacterized protein n=1 Tax=Bauhinia variegata TaxID=167791 RepID=A0ACB9NGT8_BAUVA|nr:hypothetical protein L6164_018684 [Bauhinia variegata]